MDKGVGGKDRRREEKRAKGRKKGGERRGSSLFVMFGQDRTSKKGLRKSWGSSGMR